MTSLTITSATDGNHGKSVAWGAQLFECNAVIYIHEHVSDARENAIKEYGAHVIRIKGNYEASLAACKADADKNGWQIISDTSWDGYEDIPLQVMAGYSLIGHELISQMDELPTHAFLPIGVGGLAAGIVAPLWQAMGTDLCQIISVESNLSACFQDSIAAGVPQVVNISSETLPRVWCAANHQFTFI